MKFRCQTKHFRPDIHIHIRIQQKTSGAAAGSNWRDCLGGFWCLTKIIKSKMITSLPMFGQHCSYYSPRCASCVSSASPCALRLCVSLSLSLPPPVTTQCSRRPRNLRLRIFSWSSSSMRTMPSSPSILSRIPVASRSSPRITFTLLFLVGVTGSR